MFKVNPVIYEADYKSFYVLNGYTGLPILPKDPPHLVTSYYTQGYVDDLF
jgi:hypothetical protein